MFCQASVHCVVSNSVTESASAAAAEAADLLFGLLSACLNLHQHIHIAAAIFYFMCWGIALYVRSLIHISQVGQRKVVSVLLLRSWDRGTSTVSTHLKIRLQGLAGFPASLWKLACFAEDHPPHGNIDIYSGWDSSPSGCGSLPVVYSWSQLEWTQGH